MDPTITAPTAPAHPHPHPSTPPKSASTCPQNPSICTCTTPPSKTYLSPIIGCANNKCRPRYYHLRCVGLFHRPDNELTWLCPKCAPDAPIPPRICICGDAPYRTGPMVECARQELCGTRWFHLPCVGVEFGGEEEGEWTCGECEVGIVMRREGEEEVVVVVQEGVEQQEKEKEVEPPRADGEVNGDEEEEEEEEKAEQQEYVSDGVPGVFLGEEEEEEELPAPHAASASASPLKRKSDEIDTSSRKRSKRTPTPSSSPAAEETPEYCICGTPADNDMIACDTPDCHAEWFHFVCVGLTAATIPEGEWFCEECEECEEVREKAKKNKKKKGGKGKRKR